MRPFEKQLQKWGVPENKWCTIRAAMERHPGPRTMGDNMRGSAALCGLKGTARVKVAALLANRERGVGCEESLQTVVNRRADRHRPR